MDKNVKIGFATGGINAAGSVLSAMTNQAFYKKNLEREVNAQKDLLNYQNKINQNNLLVEQSLKKQSLRNAGLSTASMNGDGTQLVGQSIPSSPSAPMPNIDMSNLGSASVQGYLNATQANLNTIESTYRGQKLELDLKLMQQRFENIKTSFPVELENLKKTIEAKDSQIQVNDSEREKIFAVIDKLVAETNGISIDNKFKEEMNTWQINKFKVECYKLGVEGNYQALVNNLANHGILVNADWFTQLAMLVSNDKLAPFIEDIFKSLGGLFTSNSVGEALGNAATGIVKGLYNSIKGIVSKGTSAAKKAFNKIFGSD